MMHNLGKTYDKWKINLADRLNYLTSIATVQEFCYNLLLSFLTVHLPSADTYSCYCESLKDGSHAWMCCTSVQQRMLGEAE